MKIAVWKTGHEIADRIAQSLAIGLNANIWNSNSYNDLECLDINNINIGYGILRGMDNVFRQSKHWFNVDRGYFNPRHFDGYYRISRRGTQFKWTPALPRKPMDIKLEPIVIDCTKDVLVCPPTDAVCNFFNISKYDWFYKNTGLGYYISPSGMEIYSPGKPFGCWGGDYVIRNKDSEKPIDWKRIGTVITFNSSVGWKALQMGLPVLSDVNHSAIGSFYNFSDFQSLTEKLYSMQDNRLELFEAMNASQFTLAEIEQGKAWPLMEHLMSSSDLIAEKPSALTSQPTQLLKEPVVSLQYTI